MRLAKHAITIQVNGTTLVNVCFQTLEILEVVAVFEVTEDTVFLLIARQTSQRARGNCLKCQRHD